MNNKFTTYLLYAIGEIILVIAGILIALQIDNSNQSKQTRALEIKYLKELKANLDFDMKDLEFNVAFNRSRFKSTKIVLGQLKSQHPYHDSLSFHFSNLVFTTITAPNSSAYESLRSKGLEIISNDSLRKQITALYTFQYNYVREFERVDDHAHQFNVVWPEVMEKVAIDSITVSANPLDFQRLKKDAKFKNMLASNLSFRGHMIARYLSLKKIVSNLIQYIEYELDILEKQGS